MASDLISVGWIFTMHVTYTCKTHINRYISPMVSSPYIEIDLACWRCLHVIVKIFIFLLSDAVALKILNLRRHSYCRRPARHKKWVAVLRRLMGQSVRRFNHVHIENFTLSQSRAGHIIIIIIFVVLAFTLLAPVRGPRGVCSMCDKTRYVSARANETF